MQIENRFIRLAAGNKIHVEIVGHGYPILCFPGFACTSYNFKFLIPFLSKKFSLVLINNRGMGQSDPAPTADYEISDLAYDGIEVMNSLGFKKFAVIGISMGGFIAQNLYFMAPTRISSLVLIASKSGGSEFPSPREVTEESFTAFSKMDPVVGNRLAITAFVHPSFGSNHPEELEKIIALRKEENIITLEEALKQLRAAWRFVKKEWELEKITAPTLVIGGKEDTFLPPENSQILARRIPKAELYLVEQTSHLCFFEKPEEISQTIISFMEKKL